MRHELKTRTGSFQAMWCGDKTFSIRNNDRQFKERDEVVFEEIEDVPNPEFTGREIEGFITYLTDFAQQEGFGLGSRVPGNRGREGS